MSGMPHDPGRWRRLQEAFAEARAAPREARDHLLAARCGNDSALRAEVESLLRADAGLGALDELAPRLPRVAHLVDEPAPERIGPYRVEGVAGRGGMGVVYRCFDPRLRRRVAVKLVSRHFLADAAARSRFIREARLASALDHPNICTVYDVGTLPDGRTWLSMAYCSRGTLADRLEHGAQPLAWAVSVARLLAAALACAHDAGIVHRDVKPRNVAFGDRDDPRLLDFGIAVLGHAPDTASDTAGTPSYMAPEQVRGEAVDARADIWALGAVLFEMVSGERLFRGTPEQVMKAITAFERPPRLAGAVPPALEQVLTRTLRPKPEERYADAHELAQALARCVEPVERPSPAPGATQRRWRARAAIAAGAVCGAAALAFVTGVPTAPLAGWRAPEAAATAETHHARGRERYHAGGQELEAAIALFESAASADPAHVPSLSFLARAYAYAARPDAPRAGEWRWVDSAEALARRAVQLAPGMPDGHSALGSVARARGQAREALAYHARALELEPGYVYSVAEVGDIHHDLLHVEESMRWRERALRLEPGLDDLRARLVIAYRSWDMPDHARRHILQGLRLKPDNATLLWERVQLGLVFGDTIDARRSLDAYLALLPPLERHRLRAWYAFIEGNPEAARAHVDRIALTAASWYDLRMYGLVYTAQGDTARGRPLLRRAMQQLLSLELSAGDPPYRVQLLIAHAYAALGEQGEALRWLRSWEQAGGSRSWSRLDLEPGWDSVRGDREFIDLVGRTGAAFERRRMQILLALERTG